MGNVVDPHFKLLISDIKKIKVITKLLKINSKFVFCSLSWLYISYLLGFI